MSKVERSGPKPGRLGCRRIAGAHSPAMPRFPTLCFFAAFLLLAGCGSERLSAPSLSDPEDAAAVAMRLDADVARMADLPQTQRLEAEASFGPRLRHDLDVCRGTRHENKPLYLLAQWSMVYGGEQGPAEALRMVDRLEILPAPAYRNAGKALRVYALLGLGRLAEARPIAVDLERDLPEFGALRRVEFYELVGQAMPPLPGTVVSGGADIPDSLFLLVAFLGMPDAAAEGWLLPLKNAGGERVRTIAVATAGDLLAASTVASAWGVEVRWTRQSDPVLAGWRLPVLPMAVLLGPGPNRLIVAVDPTPERLQRLAPAKR